MQKVKSSATVNKPIEEVFKYMASPHNGPAFIPDLSENSNIYPEEVGVGQKFDWRFNLAGVDMRGKAEVAQYDMPNKVKIDSTGDAHSIWTYICEPDGDNSTKVNVTIEYDLDDSVIQRLAGRSGVVNKIAQRTADRMLENLKLILEE